MDRYATKDPMESWYNFASAKRSTRIVALMVKYMIIVLIRYQTCFGGPKSLNFSLWKPCVDYGSGLLLRIFFVVTSW